MTFNNSQDNSHNATRASTSVKSTSAKGTQSVPEKVHEQHEVSNQSELEKTNPS